MSSTADPTARIWAALAEYLRHACSLFGMPSTLARKLWLSRAEHKLITSFLRVLEDILRRLIFILALDCAPLQPALASEHKTRPRSAMAIAAGATFDVDNPESWTVSFKLAAHLDRRRPRRHVRSTRMHAGEDAGGPSDQISSAPCAQRLEALIRGYNNRERLAKALARKLARDAAAALAYIAPVTKKRASKPGYVTLIELTPLAAEAHQRFIRRALDSS